MDLVIFSIEELGFAPYKNSILQCKYYINPVIFLNYDW